MPTSELVVRNMYPGELCTALDWAQREGWNPGLHDAACFYAADPRGFFIGLLDETPVACVSAVAYGDEFGFMGLYLVSPESRGRGYGMQLAQAGVDHLGNRVIGLDGVLAQQDNYHKSGFEFAHRNMRYLGLTGQAAAEFPQATQNMVPLSWVPFEKLAAYDRRLFPAPRDNFLRAWISQPDSCAIGIQADDTLGGYGVLRGCNEGYKIGPLFADDLESAERLFLALTARVPAGRPVYLDIPEANAAALELVERCKMEMVFETARMYKGTPPELPLEQIFGITTFELG